MADLFEIPKPPIGTIEVMSNNSIRMRVEDRKLGLACRTVSYEDNQYIISDQLSIEKPRVRFLLKKLGPCEEDGETWRMVFDDWEIQHRPCQEQLKSKNMMVKKYRFTLRDMEGLRSAIQ